MHRITSILLLATACSATTPAGTGARCPASDAPTYADFGRPFMAAYCTGCHSRSAIDRHGAPPGLDLDSEAEVRAHAAEIDADSAAGPRADNTDMPDLSGPVRVAPTRAERDRLGQFLACEVGSAATARAGGDGG